jgi:hypothetical protein
LQSNTANRIENFIQLFGNKELMFDNFFDFHIKKLKREIALMQIDLDKYEQKYNLKTPEFYEKFELGLVEDDKDFMLWTGIYEMQLSCKQKLQKLE